MNIKPRNNQVLVAFEPPEAERNGVIIPEEERVPNMWGKVIAIGPGRISEKNGQLLPVAVPVNARVLVGEVDELIPGEQRMGFVRDTDIWAVEEAA